MSDRQNFRAHSLDVLLTERRKCLSLRASLARGQHHDHLRHFHFINRQVHRLDAEIRFRKQAHGWKDAA